jgi:hypothetical protein
MKSKAATATKGTTPEKGSTRDSMVMQMLQGQGFVIDDGKFKDTDGLTAETRATIVEKLFEHKIMMCQTCLIKLNTAVCNVEKSNKFGQWMMEHGTSYIHLPLPLQLFCNMTHPDPFVPFGMQEFNVGAAIHDRPKNLIEVYVANNASICTCTDLERLLFIIEELEITYLPINSNGDINRAATTLVLIRCSDLRQLFKTHVMKSATVQIKRPSDGPISFQPAFMCTYKINASHIEMPLNWQMDKILDADEIAFPRFPGIKAALTKAASATATSTGASSHPPDEMTKKLIDAQVLLATNHDPRTFGRAITAAVSSTMTSSTRVNWNPS